MVPLHSHKERFLIDEEPILILADGRAVMREFCNSEPFFGYFSLFLPARCSSNQSAN
jgi:hypothetical protein